MQYLLILKQHPLINEQYFEYLIGKNFICKGNDELTGDTIYDISNKDSVESSFNKYAVTTLEDLCDQSTQLNTTKKVHLLALFHHDLLSSSERKHFAKQFNLLKKLCQSTEENGALLQSSLVFGFIGVPKNKTVKQLRLKVQQTYEDCGGLFSLELSSLVFPVHIDDDGISREAIHNFLIKNCSAIDSNRLFDRSISVQNKIIYSYNITRIRAKNFSTSANFFCAAVLLAMMYLYATANKQDNNVYLQLYIFITLGSFIYMGIRAASNLYENSYKYIKEFTPYLMKIIAAKNEQINEIIMSVQRILQNAEETPLAINSSINQLELMLKTIDEYTALIGKDTSKALCEAKDNISGLSQSIQSTSRVIKSEITRNGITNTHAIRQLSSEIGEFQHALASQHSKLSSDLGIAAKDGKFQPKVDVNATVNTDVSAVGLSVCTIM